MRPSLSQLVWRTVPWAWTELALLHVGLVLGNQPVAKPRALGPVGARAELARLVTAMIAGEDDAQGGADLRHPADVTDDLEFREGLEVFSSTARGASEVARARLKPRDGAFRVNSRA